MACPILSSGSVEKKTRAKPGAGTGMTHSEAAVLQGMLVMLRVPRKRPSTVS